MDDGKNWTGAPACDGGRGGLHMASAWKCLLFTLAAGAAALTAWLAWAGRLSLLGAATGLWLLAFGALSAHGVASRKERLKACHGAMPALFASSGAALLGASTASMSGASLNKAAAIAALSVMFFGGAALAAWPPVRRAHARSRCTEEVHARCAGLRTRSVYRGGISANVQALACPVWELPGRGLFCSEEYKPMRRMPEEGDERTIYVDPGNLYNYYDPMEDGSGIGWAALGAAFMAASACCLTLVLLPA